MDRKLRSVEAVEIDTDPNTPEIEEPSSDQEPSKTILK